MSSRNRASSLPSAGNPFWSEKAWNEWRIAWARPPSLPVPDWEEGEQQQQQQQMQISGGQESLGEVGTGMGERFKTPASWDGRALRGVPGVKSEGPMPREVVGKKVLRRDDDGMEREMETMMFEQVMEQNRMLQEEIKRLRKAQADQQSSTGWSEVETGDRDRERTPPPRPPARPPPPSPPSKSSLRYTPNGTRIPSLPDGAIDDLPPVPPWPFEYEPATMDHGDFYKNTGGMSETPTPQEARMKWLEREVESLRSLMVSQARGESSDYWGKPFIGDGQGRRGRSVDRREIMHEINDRDAKRRAERSQVEDYTEDALRSFPITLPKLASPKDKNSALLAGDWLTQVKPLISDVSTKAGLWWDAVWPQARWRD